VSDLFSGLGSTGAASSPPAGASNNILDLLGGGMAATAASPTPPPVAVRTASANSNGSTGSQNSGHKTYPVYNKNGFSIVFTPQRDSGNPNVVNILATFQNNQSVSGGVISGIQFHAAVTKVCIIFMRDYEPSF
jgi:AP-1 complex subunit gamma-1